jgi:diacylglycerol kinase (ATP)
MNEIETDKWNRGSGIIRSFGLAWSGLWYLLRTQRNARIELAVGAAACGLGAWLGIGRVDWAILTITVAMVLIVEGINTAIEAAVDLSTPERHPLAKVCKDVAAGMVLLAALASVAVGVLVLGVPLWNRLVK